MKPTIILSTVIGILSMFHALAVDLQVVEKKIKVNNKEASVFAITQPDGTIGLTIPKDKNFDVTLKNTLDVPTSVHWHGLILPNNQDGVAFVTQYAIYPGLSYQYKFPLVQSGTFWMHSHVGLQEQRLLSAPLIITDSSEENLADQDVTLFLADFSFKSPEEIYQNLRCDCKKRSPMEGMPIHIADLVEVDYDAFLTNYQTLSNSEAVTVEAGKKIRLRFINGSSATNFFLLLGHLEGEAIAVDGNPIKPIKASQFELAVAQRIDVIVTIPDQGGAFPILAVGEGTNKRTGLVLATKNVLASPISEKADLKVGAFTNVQEERIQALYPLPIKEPDLKLIVELGGDMAKYVWTINGKAWPESTPIIVEKGQRVEMTFKNTSMMSHPMHLHGHIFQITAINGKPLQGAMRDTVLVMPRSTLTIQFDANNAGVWPLHCHILYHMEAGMFTVMRYKDFIQPL